MDNVEKATREYLLSLITTLKKTRGALSEQRHEVDRWRERVRLAREKGREDLAQQAEQRTLEAERVLERLESEEQEVLREFRDVQGRYTLESMIPEKRIDPEQLLSALESVAGKPDSLQEELDRTRVDEQLATLKNELQNNGETEGKTDGEPRREAEE